MSNIELIFGATLFVIGFIITLGVHEICMEANKHQLWKGRLEHLLALMDKLAISLMFCGAILSGYTVLQ